MSPSRLAPHEPSISAVVCAYTLRRWDDIVAAVDSLTMQSVSALEILLVVDHNDELLTRATAFFVRSDYPLVTVLPNAERQGLSGARNTGVRESRGDVVAFLDDDATADHDWIRVLRGHYQDPAVFGVGGHADPVWPGERPNWLPREFDWVVGCSYVGQPTAVAPVRNFIGCNMSLRRSVFEMVGGFSHAIGRVGRTPLGCEETELCIRLRQRHPQAVLQYDPEMAVRHRVSDDRVRWSYFLRRCYSEGLSKAIVSRLVGAGDGLSSERAYVSRVLPAGVVRGLADLVGGSGTVGRRLAGPARSAAIVVGVAATATGYVYARVRAALGLVGAVESVGEVIPPRPGAQPIRHLRMSSDQDPYRGTTVIGPRIPGAGLSLASAVSSAQWSDSARATYPAS